MGDGAPAEYCCHQMSHFKAKMHQIQLTINQSKFIFQVITEKLQCNNVVALERLPEKHYAQ